MWSFVCLTRDWHLSLLVVLVFEKSRFFSLFFFTISFQQLLVHSVHSLKAYVGIIFIYVNRCACSGFVVCSLFPSLVANLLKRVLWKKNSDLEVCFSRHVWAVTVHLYVVLKWLYKTIILAIIHARKFCWMLEKYINESCRSTNLKCYVYSSVTRISMYFGTFISRGRSGARKTLPLVEEGWVT